MKKEVRIKKIQDITDSDANIMGRIEIPWKDDLVSQNVYKIPLDYLVYNKYNGRILSRTKSLERQNKNIDAESNTGKKLLERLLWDSRPDRNAKTLISLNTAGGQQKPGIITKDGIIIDGNRRAMLLGKTEKYDHFKAVVLPVTLDENPLEIERLETTYQMGEDEKLGYNPIEKYLKAKGLYLTLAKRPYSFLAKDIDKSAVKKIADWMGETESTVQDYLDVMETMDGYLEYLEYDGIYTQLDGREGQFVDFTRWIHRYHGENSSAAFSNYREDDVDDLKAIVYDYIRIKYEGKKLRYIAQGQRPNHFFGNQDIWNSFKDQHFKIVGNVDEEDIDLNSQNLEAHLNARDQNYAELVFEELNDNVDTHYQELRYRQAENQPSKLLKNAKRALESINQGHKSFGAPEVAEELAEVGNFIAEMMKKSSVSESLNHVLTLLDDIDFSNDACPNKEEVLRILKQIQKKAYSTEKYVKSLSSAS